MRRRDLLGSALVTLGVAGCSSLSPTHEAAANPWRNLEESSDGDVRTVSGTVDLPKGTYALREVRLETRRKVVVEFTVEGGREIDVFWLRGDQIQRYREKRDFVETDMSVGRTDGARVSDPFPGGRYAVAFDNTGFRSTDPTGDVTVQFTMLVGEPGEPLDAG